MKRIFILCLISVVSIQIYAKQDTIPLFRDEMDDALVKAQQENKQVLLYYTAEWCTPCKWMEKTVFQQDSVINFVNDHFIFMKVDIETEKGKKLVNEFPFGSIPQYNTINESRNNVYSFNGSLNAEYFLSRLKESLDPDNSILNISQKKYEAGDRSLDFLRKHLNVLQEYQSPDASKVYLDLFQKMNKEERMSAFMMEAMLKYLTSYETPDYTFVKTNRAELIEKFGENKILYLLKRPYIVELEDATMENDATLVAEKIRQLQSMDFGDLDNELYYIETNWLVKQKKYEDFIRLVEQNKYPGAFSSNEERLTSAATTAVMHADTEDKELLRKAKQWISSVENKNARLFLIEGEIEELMRNYKAALAIYEKGLALFKVENPDMVVEPTGITTLISRVKEKMK